MNNSLNKSVNEWMNESIIGVLFRENQFYEVVHKLNQKNQGLTLKAPVPGDWLRSCS